MIAMGNKAYSYLIKSANPKLDGIRKRTIASSTAEAMKGIRARLYDLFRTNKFKFADNPIIMDTERVTSETDASFATVSEMHQGYVVVIYEQMIDTIYLHYETAVSHSAGGIVVPYKIAKQRYQ